MQQKTSKTPYKLWNDVGHWISLVSGEREIIAQIDGLNQQGKANAKFILKACNEHEALLAVAEAANKLGANPFTDELNDLRKSLLVLEIFRKQNP